MKIYFWYSKNIAINAHIELRLLIKKESFCFVTLFIIGSDGVKLGPNKIIEADETLCARKPTYGENLQKLLKFEC